MNCSSHVLIDRMANKATRKKFNGALSVVLVLDGIQCVMGAATPEDPQALNVLPSTFRMNGNIDFTASIFKGQLKHSAQAEIPSLKTKCVALKH